MLEAMSLARQLLAAMRELTAELRAARGGVQAPHHADCGCNACALGLPPGRAPRA